MTANYVNRSDVRKVALALGELNERMLYVGGSIIDLYAEDPAAVAPRPTVDIDMATSTPTYTDRLQLEESLRLLGISPDLSRSLCSFTMDDIQLDIMPIEAMEIGPVNRWYKFGLPSAARVDLGDTSIKILTSPYFIATKFEAFNSRGSEMRLSPDIEDIVYVIDSRPSIVNEIDKSENDVKQFWSRNLRSWSKIPVPKKSFLLTSKSNRASRSYLNALARLSLTVNIHGVCDR